MFNILIIGYGIVGKNMEMELEKFSPDIIDKYKPQENKVSQKFSKEGYDFAFICVDTPFTNENPCDSSEKCRIIRSEKYRDKMGFR